MICHLVRSPPSVLVLLQSNETRLWSIGTGLGWLACLIVSICLWKFLPDTSLLHRRNVLFPTLFGLWFGLFGLWLTMGVDDPFYQALSAWSLQSAQVLQAHHCSLSAFNSLSTQYDRASTRFEFYSAVAALGGFLVVAIGVIALNFRGTRAAVQQYVSAMMDYFRTTLRTLISYLR